MESSRTIRAPSISTKQDPFVIQLYTILGIQKNLSIQEAPSESCTLKCKLVLGHASFKDMFYWKVPGIFLKKSSINDILYINLKPGASIRVKLTCSLLKNIFPCSVENSPTVLTGTAFRMCRFCKSETEKFPRRLLHYYVM